MSAYDPKRTPTDQAHFKNRNISMALRDLSVPTHSENTAGAITVRLTFN